MLGSLHPPSRAASRGVELDGLTVESPDLEEVYLRLVGEDLGGAEAAGEGADPDGDRTTVEGLVEGR